MCVWTSPRYVDLERWKAGSPGTASRIEAESIASSTVETTTFVIANIASWLITNEMLSLNTLVSSKVSDLSNAIDPRASMSLRSEAIYGITLLFLFMSCGRATTTCCGVSDGNFQSSFGFHFSALKKSQRTLPTICCHSRGSLHTNIVTVSGLATAVDAVPGWLPRRFWPLARYARIRENTFCKYLPESITLRFGFSTVGHAALAAKRHPCAR